MTGGKEVASFVFPRLWQGVKRFPFSSDIPPAEFVLPHPYTFGEPFVRYAVGAGFCELGPDSHSPALMDALHMTRFGNRDDPHQKGT